MTKQLLNLEEEALTFFVRKYGVGIGARGVSAHGSWVVLAAIVNKKASDDGFGVWRLDPQILDMVVE
jgi:hypothetical protein